MNSIKQCNDCGYRTIAHKDLQNCSRCGSHNLETTIRVIEEVSKARKSKHAIPPQA